MKYLKKYNLITEGNKLDLDIETFKELMYDITDNYDYDVNYHTSSTGEIKAFFKFKQLKFKI